MASIFLDFEIDVLLSQRLISPDLRFLQRMTAAQGSEIIGE